MRYLSPRRTSIRRHDKPPNQEATHFNLKNSSKPKDNVPQNPMRHGSLSFGEGRGEVKELVMKTI